VHRDSPTRRSDHHWQVGAGTPIGVCAGPGLGLVLGDLPLGFAVGLAVGAGVDGVTALRRSWVSRHPGGGPAHQGPGPA